ncbi:MAG: hypothetical protein JXB39_05085 [Deltaproteobacteria bacterium]|nr:hypothetical protein [Deltaproteobacteria bacterium]
MGGRRALVGLGLGAILVAGILVAAVRLPSVLEHLATGGKPVRSEPAADATEDVQDRVRRMLPAVGLETSDLVEEATEERGDAVGTWKAWLTRWRLPVGEDARAVGQRLVSLLAASQAEAYEVDNEGGAVEVRVYGGTRLAARLTLEPTLPEWPAVASESRALFAVVLDAVDHDPHTSNRLLDIPQPLAVALSPYSPYTLRMARDAVSRRKEVVARVEPDTTPMEALDAVPHASGVLLSGPPMGAPETQAAGLKDQRVYALDATPAGLPAEWIRALKAAGVPRVRAFRPPVPGSADALKAFRSRVAREGSGVLVLDVDDPIARPALDSLAEAPRHGFRPAFAAEVVDEAAALP